MWSIGSQRCPAPRYALVWCGLLVLTGCGKSGPAVGKLVPVRGKATVAGKPLNEGSVAYYPINSEEKMPIPEGKIQSDGSYVLTTAGKPGAPVGKYRVAVDPGGDKEVSQRIDRRYTSSKNSPQEITVEDRPDQCYDLVVPVRQDP